MKAFETWGPLLDGSYTVTNGARRVKVFKTLSHIGRGHHWSAVAEWDERISWRLLTTKAEAVAIAKHMINKASEKPHHEAR